MGGDGGAKKNTEAVLPGKVPSSSKFLITFLTSAVDNYNTFHSFRESVFLHGALSTPH